MGKASYLQKKNYIYTQWVQFSGIRRHNGIIFLNGVKNVFVK